MTAAWPGSLPQVVQQNNYQETAPNTVVRTPMDQGPAKTRQRFTAGVRNFNIQLWLTATQTETLDSFFTDTIGYGALSFTWVHPRKGTACTMRITNQPQYVAQGPDFLASLQVEIMP